MKPIDRVRRGKRYHGPSLFRAFLLLLLIGALSLSFIVLREFLGPIILAILLAGLAHPVYRWVFGHLGRRKSLSALVMVVLTTFVIVVPVFLFLVVLLTQGADFVRSGVEWLRQGRLQQLLDLEVVDKIERWYTDVFGRPPEIRNQLVALGEAAARGFVNGGMKLFGNTLDLISKFGIFVFVLFFLFRDGPEMIDALRDLLPMRRTQTDRIFAQINDVTQAVLLGTFLVSFIQGVLGAIGLLIVGIPALVWGTAIGFSSMIPMVGTFLITVPIIAYLFLTGSYWQGVFFVFWAFLVVGGIDNILRPFFMKGRARMSPFFVFLGVIGGISYFGVSGLLYGPMVIALTMVILRIYRVEFSGELDASRPRS